MPNKYNIPDKDYKHIEGLAYKVYEKSFAGIDLEDLIQEGVLGYLLAKENYDSDKNDYFMGFAYKKVYGRMLDWVAKNSLNKYGAIKKSLKDKEGWLTATPEDYEDFHINENYAEDIEKYMLQEDIRELLNDYFTNFELKILHDYFIKGYGLIKTANINDIPLSNLKFIIVKSIIFIRNSIQYGKIERIDKDEVKKYYNSF